MLAVPSRSLGRITNREFSRPFHAPHSIWQQSQERQGGVRPGLTQCSSHPARSPAVGVVPAQACWGSQRIPSPCHKWLWAGTPAHSNRLATARAACPRSFHSPSYSHSPSHTLTHTHLHSHTLSHAHPLGKSGRRQNLFCWSPPHPHSPAINAISIYSDIADYVPHARD